MQLALYVNKVEKLFSIFHECPGLKGNFEPLSNKLRAKVRDLNPTDGDTTVNFITNPDQHRKIFLLLGSSVTNNIMICSFKRFVAVAIGKIYEIHTEKMQELGPQWLTIQLILTLF